ncbi:hypothetical protein I3900191A7_07490 [Clostridium baratii]
MVPFSKGWGEIMSNCPFWSSEFEGVKCNSECPMKQDLEKDEDCVFKEYLDETSLGYGNLVNVKGYRNL